MESCVTYLICTLMKLSLKQAPGGGLPRPATAKTCMTASFQYLQINFDLIVQENKLRRLNGVMFDKFVMYFNIIFEIGTWRRFTQTSNCKNLYDSCNETMALPSPTFTLPTNGFRICILANGLPTKQSKSRVQKL